ncbi:MAG: restriction endonuclease subunit S [Candidatus Pacearchaeota archaeon]|jgi:type I restriction enzyme S subunit
MKQQTQTDKIEWREVELGNKILFNIQSGGTPSRAKTEYWENGKIPWIGSTACKDLPIHKAEQFITEDGLKNSSAKIFPKNTILIALVGATIGKTGLLKFDCATNQNIVGINIIDSTNISPDYLFFSSKQLYPKFMSLSGDTFKMATLSFIRSLKIPLPFSNGKPDLKEQERIVRILENSEKQKEKSKNVEDLLDEYLKSIFNELFYNKGFEEIELGNKIYFEITMGQSPAGTSYNKIGKGTPFFQGKKEFGEKYPSVEQWTTEPSKLAKPNDILISVRAPVGSINLANIKCCIGRGLASIRCKEDIKMDFVYSFLKIKEKEIENLGNGSTFKAITSGQLLGIKIPLPPPHLQQKFAKIVEQVENMKENIKKTKQNSEQLFNSLMQKAFRGEL